MAVSTHGAKFIVLGTVLACAALLVTMTTRESSVEAPVLESVSAEYNDSELGTAEVGTVKREFKSTKAENVRAESAAVAALKAVHSAEEAFKHAVAMQQKGGKISQKQQKALRLAAERAINRFQSMGKEDVKIKHDLESETNQLEDREEEAAEVNVMPDEFSESWNDAEDGKTEVVTVKHEFKSTSAENARAERAAHVALKAVKHAEAAFHHAVKKGGKISKKQQKALQLAAQRALKRYRDLGKEDMKVERDLFSERSELKQQEAENAAEKKRPTWRMERDTVWKVKGPMLQKADKAMYTTLKAQLKDKQSKQWRRYLRHLNLTAKKVGSKPGHKWVSPKGTSKSGMLIETSQYGARNGRLCDRKVRQKHGYFKIKGGQDKNYFYWLFEARKAPKNAPLVMWLSGGPGCSSELALFSENGPCTVRRDGRGTKPNRFSWNNEANIVFVDQPAGTGFSYGASSDYDHNEAEVADDLHHFMQELVRVHPQFHRNDFYVFGESYAGHYVPATAHRIYQGNKSNKGQYIALRGFGIGNGLTDPEVQYPYYPKMAFKSSTTSKVVSARRYRQMKQAVPLCTKAIRSCQRDTRACPMAMSNCNVALITPVQETGVNLYDLRQKCKYPPLCYDFSHVKNYLNSGHVKRVLGVKKSWASCNMRVNMQFQSDWMKNYERHIPSMLHNGHTALIYAGDVDFICNWMGNKAWTKKMKWHGQRAYRSARDKSWKIGGKTKARVRSAKGLTFVQIHEAGHMVPMDQPEASLTMLNQWLKHKVLLTEDAAQARDD